jgi:WD40 repeat protein
LHIAAHRDRLHSLAFAPDGRTLATASDDQFVRLWSLPSGRLGAEHREPAEVFELAYRPMGDTLAVAGRSGLITLVDPVTLSPQRTIRSDESEVRALAFSPDGHTLAASGVGRTIRLWDPVTGQELLALGEPTAQVNGLAFRPDGLTLAACDHSGRIWFYRADGP